MFAEQKDKFDMRGQFTPDISALVLIDFQVGTLQLIRNVSSDVSLRNAVLLTKAAERLEMPIIFTTSQEDHIQGPLAPALQKASPAAYKARVKRVGIVNAWSDRNLSAAIESTGRKNLIMCGPARLCGTSGGRRLGLIVRASRGDVAPKDGAGRRRPDNYQHDRCRAGAGLVHPRRDGDCETIGRYLAHDASCKLSPEGVSH